ncbi:MULTISPECIES: SDR family NAD(P)-dependent oxidoreductase [Nocardiopsis]|jgi:NAD(P)-dependent dehydrogenase (short-subunit alcohol dehydrogenase family)|uniref:SDR family NAD(P)-dependent oxidoreductase n=2 Tax=Nocardiopsis alba TaxID=53437 RepID=A0A7K2IVP7_9ACTN|nr:MULTISPECIES: SDR family oxidoreductase [Nocardiopsis]AFR07242.1 short chain dehydrogenase family protein [Nocardiopsis alba ATCC BAA-2165]MEC3894261.1 SDR family oxidoreductase [Nocardiopsis sp. LDBS1602]MYR34049.1 SDR family NAD(P)-dependent oxidoreductase [Nocardiopsis alba]
MTTPLPRHLRRLPGQNAIVTGASGAFGSATVAVLRHIGVNVVGLDRKPSPGVIACDITDDRQVEEGVAEAVDRLDGDLDLLVHYAGIGPSVDIGHMPDSHAHQALEVNLLGTWRVTAAAMPHLVRSRGRVIVTASLLAGLQLPLAGAYTVSKRAVSAYADCLRAEYGTHVGVTTIYPGFVDTPIHESSRATGASLDGLVPAETERDTVMAVVRAAGAKHPPRDIASTALGTAALHLTRHFPGTTEQIVALQLGLLLTDGAFADAEIARGLHARYGTPHAQTTRS